MGCAYAGSWVGWPQYMTIRPNGELYFCLSETTSNPPTNVYKSLTHGNAWKVITRDTKIGSRVSIFTPTSTGYVCHQNGSVYLWYSTDLVNWVNKRESIWSIRGDIYCPYDNDNYVWTPGNKKSGINQWFMQISSNGGATWGWGNNQGSGGYYRAGGRVRINSALTRGIAGNAGTGDSPIWSTNPTMVGGSSIRWTIMPGHYQAHRHKRPAIAYPRLVFGEHGLPGGHFLYSLDSGDTNFERDITAGMTQTDPGITSFPDYDITCSGDLVLCHLNESVTPGIYRSTDFGVTWTRVHDNLAASDGQSGIQIDPWNANIVYAWGDTLGFWRSDDGGLTWTARNHGLQGTFCPYPSSDITRITGIRHLYNAFAMPQETYNNIAILGGISPFATFGRRGAKIPSPTGTDGTDGTGGIGGFVDDEAAWDDFLWRESQGEA